MLHLLKRQISHASLLRMLLFRDFEARYKGSFLGNLWPFVIQASQIALYTYVFSTILKVKVDVPGFEGSRLAFAVWLFAGFLPWMAFTNGLLLGANSVTQQANLVKKVIFPLPLLPIVPVLTSLVESLMGLLLLLMLVAYHTHELKLSVLLLPAIWLLQLMFTAGLGFIVSSLTVYVRDIPQTLGIVLNVWFYLTPIVYPRTSVPQALQNAVFTWNPIIPLVDAYRDLILVGYLQHPEQLSVTLLLTLVTFGIGLALYKRLQPAFADVL